MNDKPHEGDRIAYFGRVSSPKQRLEHHWEPVERWATANGLVIPEGQRFEDKIRRHESASFFQDWDKRKRNAGRKEYRFDAMMRLVEAGELDWIVISNFDRWGIRNKDEIFVFRSKLREYDVGLYAVVDDLNITGLDDASFWRVAAAAEGATKYVSQLAEKNIAKMVSMAEGGWATTGNAPFGLDLVLYKLDDLTRPIWRVIRTRYNRPHGFRVVYYKPSSRVDRDENGHIVNARLEVEREEWTNSPPPRDKKTTGYKYEPGDARSLEAVVKMFEMYDAELEFGAISESLWRQGYKHYDKPFGYHGVETILSNTGYIGKPAWGKLGVGEYRVVLDKKPVQPKRKKDDTLTMKKAEADWVFPLKTVFPPIVPTDLFDRVKKKLYNRPHVNESFGKRRTRDKASHPLNGKLHCPDCEAPMVLGSFTPGTKTMAKTKGKARKKHCFVCGTYRKTIRTQCHANTVAWDKLDDATDELLKMVADRIDTVKRGDISSLEKSEWLKKSELGQNILNVVYAVLGKGKFPGGGGTSALHGYLTQKLQDETEFTLEKIELEDGVLDNPDAPNVFRWAFDAYDREFDAAAQSLKAELQTINEELDAIADELPVQRKKNPAFADRLDKKAGKLEGRRKEIEPQLVPMTEQARATMEQLQSIRETIKTADKLKLALLLDSFIEKVYPVFDVKKTKSKTKPRRTEIIGFRFVPRATAKKLLSEEMEIRYNRTGTGSLRKRG